MTAIIGSSDHLYRVCYKVRQLTLLQSAIVYFYKVRQFYWQVWRLLFTIQEYLQNTIGKVNIRYFIKFKIMYNTKAFSLKIALKIWRLLLSNVNVRTLYEGRLFLMSYYFSPHNIGINLSSAVEIEHLTTQNKSLEIPLSE